MLLFVAQTSGSVCVQSSLLPPPVNILEGARQRRMGRRRNMATPRQRKSWMRMGRRRKWKRLRVGGHQRMWLCHCINFSLSLLPIHSPLCLPPPPHLSLTSPPYFNRCVITKAASTKSVHASRSESHHLFLCKLM